MVQKHISLLRKSGKIAKYIPCAKKNLEDIYLAIFPDVPTRGILKILEHLTPYYSFLKIFLAIQDV